MLNKLVCPSKEIIDWVASEMQAQRAENIQEREQIISSVQTQIERIKRMDNLLYDDKLAGDIPKEKYDLKHAEFLDQKTTLQNQMDKLDSTITHDLEQRLVLLELSQRATEIYQQKQPEQKRLIITKLFEKMTSKDDSVSVTYASFVSLIAENVSQTNNLIGE